jgi:hypothetical protein
MITVSFEVIRLAHSPAKSANEKRATCCGDEQQHRDQQDCVA